MEEPTPLNVGAVALHELYVSLLAAGFQPVQALWMVTQVLLSAQGRGR